MRLRGPVGFAVFVEEKVMEETGDPILAHRMAMKAMYFGLALQFGFAVGTILVMVLLLRLLG